MDDKFLVHIAMTPGLRQKCLLTGVVLCLAGIIGVMAPSVFSIAISEIIAAMLMLSGIVLFFFYYFTGKRDVVSWIKCLSPLVLGVLLAVNPFAGSVVLGLLLFMYFVLDGFAGISFGLELKPQKGWLMVFIDGLASLTLAAIFILGWPFSTKWFVGLMVGISLLLDGVALIALAVAAKEIG